MKHNKNNGSKVPNLRFPEFEGQWKRTTLENISEIGKGSGISKGQLSLNGLPCILYGELYTKYKSEIITEIISRTDIDVSNLFRSKTNDVIIPSSGETAIDISTARCVLCDDVLLGGDLNVIRLKNGDGRFLSYQLNGIRKLDIAKMAQGVSVVHLYGEKLKSLQVIEPEVIEQQKIASLLSLIDERISTQNKIIEELKLLKGAMRYKLYSNLNHSNSVSCEFKTILNYEQPTKYIVDKDKYCSDSSLVAVLTANKAFVLGYTSEKSGIYDKGECIIFDDFTMDSKFVDFPFKVKSSAIKILRAKDGFDAYFVFEYIAYLRLSSEEHKRHYISEIESRCLNVPHYDTQLKIASLLRQIENRLINTYEITELYLTQKQYLLCNMFI